MVTGEQVAGQDEAGTTGAAEDETGELLEAGLEEAGADEAGALVAGALVAGAVVAGAELSGALVAGLEEAGALDWVTGNEVVETTVERAGQLRTSGPQLVIMISLVDITTETEGATGAVVTGELLETAEVGPAGA